MKRTHNVAYLLQCQINEKLIKALMMSILSNIRYKEFCSYYEFIKFMVEIH